MSRRRRDADDVFELVCAERRRRAMVTKEMLPLP